MRIGVNCLPLQPQIGGLRQYFQRLFRELLATDGENNYIFFYADQNRGELDLIGNDRWQECAIRVADDGEILPHLMTVDLFFCPLNSLWPRPLPVASVVQLADIQEEFYPEFFTDQELQYRAVHYRGSTRAADAVLTISDHSRQTIAERHRIDDDKIFVTPLVADESFAEPVAEETVGNLDLPRKYLFYPANHWLHKNHDGLLRALRHLKVENGVTVPAVLTGFSMGNGYPLHEKIVEYGLSEQVTVVGYVSHYEMRGLFQRATLLCFPSLFEGFGMPIVEAMTAGCPVACSNVTSMPEVAGEAALYFDPTDPRDIADKILGLWQDELLRDRLVAQGRRRAGAFTAARMAEVHKQAFLAALASFNNESRRLYAQYIYDPLDELKRRAEAPGNEFKPAQEAPLHDRDAVNAALLKRLERLDQLESSLSWRLTAPLRKLCDCIRRFGAS